MHQCFTLCFTSVFHNRSASLQFTRHYEWGFGVRSRLGFQRIFGIPGAAVFSQLMTFTLITVTSQFWIFKAGSDEDSVDNERPPLCNFGQSTNQSKHWSDVGRRERGMQYSSPSSSSSSSSLWWWWSSGGLHIIPIQCKRQKNSIKRKEVATVFASYIILICFRICTSPGNILTLLAHFFQYNQAFIIQQSTKGGFFWRRMWGKGEMSLNWKWQN